MDKLHTSNYLFNFTCHKYFNIYHKDIKKRIKDTRNKINEEINLFINKAKEAYNLQHHPLITHIGLTLATKFPIPASWLTLTTSSMSL